jgi:predicted extracellular nuclease
MKLLVFASLFLSTVAFSQTRTVGFYNVENLFDTINDPNINDEDFLPSVEKNWNQARYNEKIAHINAVLDLMGNPLAVGFCEIENAAVMRDVIRHNPNRVVQYGLVHFDSPDLRGIDVALMYDSLKMKFISAGKLRFDLVVSEENKYTRDIIWSKFVSKKDTLFFMVNHWPSRRGGETKSEPNRLEAAKNARKFIDSIQTVNAKTKIIFMGDLNDYPTNKAPQLIAEKLTPMITKSSGEFAGTYSYKGEWDVLDHIFVSPTLFAKKKFAVVPNSGKIYSDSFLIDTFKGNKVPFRTYAGKKFLGGYSDHLPVSIEIKLP